MKGVYYVENGQIITGSAWDAEIHGVDYVLTDEHMEIAGQLFTKESDSMFIVIPSDEEGVNDSGGNPYRSNPNEDGFATADSGDEVQPTESSHGRNPGHTRPERNGFDVNRSFGS